MSDERDPQPPARGLAEKPPPEMCPRAFCFHYLPAGVHFAPGFHPSLEAALRHAQPVPEARCGFTLGRCTRLGVPGADRDWYEPNEPELQKAGLPWFFFIPSADQLVPELREEYLRDSARFWGEDSTSR